MPGRAEAPVGIVPVRCHAAQTKERRMDTRPCPTPVRFEVTMVAVIRDRFRSMSTLQSAKPAHDGEEILFEGRVALIPSVGTLVLAVLTLGLWLVVRWAKTLGQSYRVTTRRIVVETGVLSKKLEQIDLYRIADYTVDRPFGQRLMGTGNLLLKTFDKTSPELDLRCIKTDVVGLYERLRAATEADKVRRGVRMVDYESGK
jgi:uncharacterized membrane protein YdbT with pleckstrin-like domain